MMRYGRLGVILGLMGLIFFPLYLQSRNNGNQEFFCRDTTVLFTNANFITLDPKRPLASAIAVDQQRILAVGDQTTLLNRCQRNDPQVIDLKGATVIPGFIDTHSQFLLNGWLSEQAWDLSATNTFQKPDWHEVRSIKEFLASLKGKMANKEGWLIVNGYDPLRMKGEALTQTMLNDLQPDIPTLVFYSSGNQILVNQAAAQKISTLPNALQITIDQGGFIYHQALQALLHILINKDQAIRAIQTAAHQYAQQGYTTVTEAVTSNPVWLSAYEQVAAQPGFPVDVIFTPDSLVEHERMKAIYQDTRRLYSGPVLVQLDGAPQEGSAFFNVPLLPSTHHSHARWPENLKIGSRELENILMASGKKNIPVILECNGDAAVDLALNVTGKAQRLLQPSSVNPVILNAPYIRADQVQRMQQMKLKLNWFASHISYWGQEMCELLYSHGWYSIPYFASAPFILNSLSIEANSPTTPPIPLQMLQFLNTGKIQNGTAGQKCPQSFKLGISAHEALNTLTLNAALVYGLQNDKGSLAPGKLADMTMLSANPLQPANLGHIKVLGTITRGIVHLSATPP
jgi:predicted amidohydrolase YtcJ